MRIPDGLRRLIHFSRQGKHHRPRHRRMGIIPRRRNTTLILPQRNRRRSIRRTTRIWRRMRCVTRTWRRMRRIIRIWNPRRLQLTWNRCLNRRHNLNRKQMGIQPRRIRSRITKRILYSSFPPLRNLLHVPQKRNEQDLNRARDHQRHLSPVRTHVGNLLLLPLDQVPSPSPNQKNQRKLLHLRQPPRLPPRRRDRVQLEVLLFVMSCVPSVGVRMRRTRPGIWKRC